MKKVSITWGLLAAAAFCIALIALAVSKLLGANYWIVLIAVTVIVYINGLLKQRKTEQVSKTDSKGPFKFTVPPERTDK